MSNLRQAAQQALEALEKDSFSDFYEWAAALRDARDALRAALAEPDSDYERGFVDGMNLQTKGSVGKTVNRMAEPEQEPVAWAEEIIDDLHALYDTEMIRENDSGDALIRLDDAIACVEDAKQHHTAPTPRKPLTVFEIDAIAEHLDKTTIGWATHEFAAAIEKAHGIGEQHE